MPASLQQIQTQKLLLTPEQIQMIKMLELPATELQQRVNEELQENPVLELGEAIDDKEPIAEENDYTQDDDCSDVFGEEQTEDPLINEDFDYSQYTSDDEYDNDYYYNGSSPMQDDDQRESPIIASDDFYDYLKEQVGHLKLTEQERQITEYIIGNIDTRGYLTRTPEQMVDDLAFHVGIEISNEEMQHLVDLVRHLDPVGVGAYNLQDCLLMQLRSKKQTEDVQRATLFVEKHFVDVSKHHYNRLQKRYNISEQQVKVNIFRARQSIREKYQQMEQYGL